MAAIAASKRDAARVELARAHLHQEQRADRGQHQRPGRRRCREVRSEERPYEQQQPRQRDERDREVARAHAGIACGARSVTSAARDIDHAIRKRGLQIFVVGRDHDRRPTIAQVRDD